MPGENFHSALHSVLLAPSSFLKTSISTSSKGKMENKRQHKGTWFSRRSKAWLSEKNYILSHVQPDTPPVRHSVLLFRPKGFLFTWQLLFWGAKCLHNHLETCGSPPLVWEAGGEMEATKLCDNTFSSLPISHRNSKGNVWLLAQAHATSRWFCKKSRYHCAFEGPRRLRRNLLKLCSVTC